MHGFSRLGDQNKLKKVFWSFTCLFACLCLIWLVTDLSRKYHDPENLKTVITIDKALRKSLINDSRLQQEIYPSIVLCAADPTVNLSKFQAIQIIQNRSDGRSSVHGLPPLRPMYIRKVGREFGAFKMFGMCAKLFEKQKDITLSIKWNGVDEGLVLQFSLENDVPNINLKTSDGFKGIPIVQPKTSIKIHISHIKIFRFYTGSYSKYSNEYPDFHTPSIDFYYKGHCVDLLFLEEIGAKSLCHQKYKSILNAIQGPKGDWKKIEEYGCKSQKKGKPFSGIDCGCKPKGWTLTPHPLNPKHTEKNETLRNRVMETCKKNAVHIEFELTITSEESQHPDDWSKISLKRSGLQVVTTTQSHAMDLGDLFAQIGGFLGLLIGASAMSILEVLEFLIQSFCQYLKYIWQSRVVPISIH